MEWKGNGCITKKVLMMGKKQRGKKPWGFNIWIFLVNDFMVWLFSAFLLLKKYIFRMQNLFKCQGP